MGAVSDFQEKTQECLTSWGPRSHAMKPVYSIHKHLCLQIAEPLGRPVLAFEEMRAPGIDLKVPKPPLLALRWTAE